MGALDVATMWYKPSTYKGLMGGGDKGGGSGGPKPLKFRGKEDMKRYMAASYAQPETVLSPEMRRQLVTRTTAAAERGANTQAAGLASRMGGDTGGAFYNQQIGQIYGGAQAQTGSAILDVEQEEQIRSAQLRQQKWSNILRGIGVMNQQDVAASNSELATWQAMQKPGLLTSLAPMIGGAVGGAFGGRG